MVVERTTISGNLTPAGSGGGSGGGLFVQDTNTTTDPVVRDSTISGNTLGGTAGATGAGINNISSDGGGPADPPIEVDLTNSIVANNDSATSGEGDLGDGGGQAVPFFVPASLVEDTSGGTLTFSFGAPSILGQDPQLGGLASNGGQTQTHLPGPLSPVVDKGAFAAATDQRGVGRPIDIPSIPNATASGDDIGAVELTLAEATPPATIAPPPSGVDVKALIKKCKKK